MWRRRVIILSVVLAVVSQAPADEAYTLKFKGRSTGQRIVVDKTETKEGRLTTIFTDEETLKEEKHKDTVATGTRKPFWNAERAMAPPYVCTASMKRR